MRFQKLSQINRLPDKKWLTSKTRRGIFKKPSPPHDGDRQMKQIFCFFGLHLWGDIKPSNDIRIDAGIVGCAWLFLTMGRGGNVYRRLGMQECLRNGCKKTRTFIQHGTSLLGGQGWSRAQKWEIDSFYKLTSLKPPKPKKCFVIAGPKASFGWHEIESIPSLRAGSYVVWGGICEMNVEINEEKNSRLEEFCATHGFKMKQHESAESK